jgi:hypothetical protein
VTRVSFRSSGLKSTLSKRRANQISPLSRTQSNCFKHSCKLCKQIDSLFTPIGITRPAMIQTLPSDPIRAHHRPDCLDRTNVLHRIIPTERARSDIGSHAQGHHVAFSYLNDKWWLFNGEPLGIVNETAVFLHNYRVQNATQTANIFIYERVNRSIEYKKEFRDIDYVSHCIYSRCYFFIK